MRRKYIFLFLIAVFMIFIASTAVFAEQKDFLPNPKTAYSKKFIKQCQGEYWFMNEIERLLNFEQKSINTIESGADFKYIKSIGMADRDIKGKIPTAIGELSELEYLFLNGNRFSGNLPEELFQLNKLKTIDLGNNNYKGNIPKGFKNLPRLNSLILKNNKYTGRIPKEILTGDIEILNLAGNRLEGGIPAEINLLTNIKYLNLSRNNFGGNLPDLSSLTELEVLSLWDTGIDGEIPDSLYTLLKLQILDIADNGLTGEIKSDIGDLNKLELLNLAGNKFEGEIPGEIENLSKLKRIDLSGNKIRGIIPDVFISTELKDVNLSDNYLRGKIPESVKNINDSGGTVKLKNNYLTGDDMKNISENNDNFVDSIENQYQFISMDSSIAINKETKINIYPKLKNKRLLDGNIMQKRTLKPDEYEKNVIGGNPHDIEISEDENGIYIKALKEISFSDKITLEVSIKGNIGSEYSKTVFNLWTKAENPPNAGGIGGFSENEDKNADSDEHKELEIHKPYVKGYPGDLFCPDRKIIREEIAKMIISALEIEPGVYKFESFKDVKRNKWSFRYIEEAKDREYMKGIGNKKFMPVKNITRAELATILVRIGKQRGETLAESNVEFKDVKKGKWYSNNVMEAFKMGLIKGYVDKTFKPDKEVTRAEAVTMINRMLKRNPRDAEELKLKPSPFKDVKRGYWAYYEILEASLLHNHKK